MPLARVVSELIKNKIYLTANENIDQETALIVAQDLGLQAEIQTVETKTESAKTSLTLKASGQNLKPRPTVVTFLGHVDHGKTSLIDKIRQTHVADSETGQITQHLNIYELPTKDEKLPGLTLIDTPGHEAFSSIRERGASLTDIAVLVVSASEGIKEQTKESIKIIKLVCVPLVVAINKIDEPRANPEKIKQQLVDAGITLEEWGGDTIIVNTSAKTGQGIDELIELLSLKAQTLELKADAEGEFLATVLEAGTNHQSGIYATILIQNGSLVLGQKIYCQIDYLGKIKILKSTDGKNLSLATPGRPAIIYGLKKIPQVKAILQDHQLDPTAASKDKSSQKIKQILDSISKLNRQTEFKFNLILKADTAGSLEALLEMLAKVKSDRLGLNILEVGLGQIQPRDIEKARVTHSLIIGFHSVLSPTASALAKETGVKVKLHQIIYKLKEDLLADLVDFLPAERIEKASGNLEVLAVFRTESASMIVGGKVINGEIKLGQSLKVERAGQDLGRVTLVELHRQDKNVKTVSASGDCGLKIKGNLKIQAGDLLTGIEWEEKKIKVEF